MSNDDVKNSKATDILREPIGDIIRRQMCRKVSIWGWSPLNDDEALTKYRRDLSELSRLLDNVPREEFPSEVQVLICAILDPTLHHECTRVAREQEVGELCLRVEWVVGRKIRDHVARQAWMETWLSGVAVQVARGSARLHREMLEKAYCDAHYRMMA